MASNIKPDKLAVSTYDEMQTGKKYRFVTFKFNDKRNEIVLADTGGPDATFEDLLAVIPKDHPRYIFFDCRYETIKDKGSRSKIIFVTWSNDTEGEGRERMLSSSSSQYVKNKCKGFAKYTTINAWEDLTEANFIDIVSDNKTK